MAAAVKVVVTDYTFPTLQQEQDASRAAGAEFAAFQCRTAEDVADAVEGAKVALVQFAPFTAAAAARLAPGAAVIRYGVGYDNIDVAACTEVPTGTRHDDDPDRGVVVRVVERAEHLVGGGGRHGFVLVGFVDLHPCHTATELAVVLLLVADLGEVEPLARYVLPRSPGQRDLPTVERWLAALRAP